MKRTATRKLDKTMPASTGDPIADIMMKGGMNAPIDEYAEKPRPSLFNVIKKLKEQTASGKIVNRLCYVARIKDSSEYKENFKGELTNWMRSIATSIAPLESNEDDFKEGNDPEELQAPQSYTGYAAIFGAWHVHLIESENPLMNKFIKGLEEKLSEENSYYAGIWVVHYTEDVPRPAYENWECEMFKDQTDVNIKEYPDYEKMAVVYEAMVKVGYEAY